MASAVQMKVEGLKEIERMLRKLPQRNQKKIKRGALRAGADVVRKEIRQAIDQIPNDRLRPSGKERFKKSVGIVTSKSTWWEGKVFVGPRYSGVKHIAPEAHLFEFGTDQRRTKSGESRGAIQPTPFVQPGWERSRRKAVEDTRRELVERTIQEAIKLRRGH